MTTLVSSNSQAGGIRIGAPGPVGSALVSHFAAAGDPNLFSDSDLSLTNAALGSLFSRVDGPDATHCLYVKTGVASAANPTGVWTPK